ncbi:LppP/LprE family lipoprotein [Mycolicibacterium hodleri]|uniref:LppP/LprE family lipoprotein n=1 Tax=Mycolicibacterium hodleri TaxID=49897 RepID=A0A502EGC5_9MYCO|nr:LppP/LprE family lipoprotein [Mycolicibacterium hodleri]TPG36042.1 LppP/LprE family lipoprotein [Mycolicibacterium hodleri]
MRRRRWFPVLVAVAVLAGCGSSDSTVSKTPEATVAPAQTAPPAPAPTVASGPSPTPAPPDPCAIDLAAPEIAKAVSELPRDPRSGQPWSPEPLAGNYSECAQLSAIVITANTNMANPNTRAVLFHLGKVIPEGVPDTYGFNGIDDAATTGDTVALMYLNDTSGLKSVVRFRWNGNGVELVGNTG